MSGWYQRIKRRLGADRKQAAIVLGLAAVLLLLWGRLLLKNVPRTALADPADQASAAAADNPDPIPGASAHRRVVRVELPDHVTRDLFALDWSRFPRADAGAGSVRTGPKSGDGPADEGAGTVAVMQAAQALKLQSTVLGESPRALINGRFVAPGQMIEDFVLKEVGPREVVLEKEGIEVRLAMH